MKSPVVPQRPSDIRIDDDDDDKRSWWNKVVQTTPTCGPGEELANILGSFPRGYFKHHYSFIVF